MDRLTIMVVTGGMVSMLDYAKKIPKLFRTFAINKTICPWLILSQGLFCILVF